MAGNFLYTLAGAEVPRPWPDYCQVVDGKNQVQSPQWLWNKYGQGISFLYSNVTGKIFRLIEVRETLAPALIKVQVLGLDGKPIQGIYAGNHWPDPSLPLTEGARRRWETRAVAQPTDANGLTGFGLGAGSVIKGDCGPHTVWVLSPTADSDGLSGIGWLGGTDHHGPLHLTFQLFLVEEPDTPEEKTKFSGTLGLGPFRFPFRGVVD